MTATALRLPGITFETRHPPVTTPLPRMDIAGLVGFARSGPIDVPVAVEDVPRFHDIFGEDVALAADPSRGDTVYAELPAAVRAFFRNGGARCWIVRVADRTAAGNTFLIPGLLAKPPAESGVGGALALARSAGSWSDELAVNATIAQRPLATLAVSPPGAGPFQVTGLSAGDLLQIDCPALDIVAFDPVPATSAQPPLTVAVPSPGAYWFRRAHRRDVDTMPGSPPAAIVWLPAPVDIRWLAGAVPPAVDPPLPIARWGVRDEGFIVELDRSAVGVIRPGTWLRITVTAPPPLAKPTLLLLVKNIEAAHPDSPPASGEPVWVTAANAWWVLDAAAASIAVASQTLHASVVELELWVRDPAQPLRRLANLGCATPHPRYWGDVPNDDVVFRRDDRRPTRLDRISRLLLDDVLIPRFPLAAPVPPEAAQPYVFLPLGVPGFQDDTFYQTALPLAGDRLTRDGLATFHPRLFIDSELDRTTAANLITEAFQIQYVNVYPPASTTRAVGRDLTGMHALMPIDEVSMIAVPDAVQRAWHPEPSRTPPLGAPALVDVSPAAGATHLVWTPVAPDSSLDHEEIEYDAQASHDPRFAVVARRWHTTATTLDDDPIDVSLCRAPIFYRVRATSSIRGSGPWSNTGWIDVPLEDFQRCPNDLPPAPDPIAAVETHGRLVVTWNGVAPAGAAFTLERASDPEFVSAAAVYTGTARTYEVLRGAEPVVYFRVAAAIGARQSPWSVTAIVGVLDQIAFVTEDADAYDEGRLQTIHTALIRMCAGRADAHAVLGLPAHFREDRASAFIARLSNDLITTFSEDIRALSYAAVFHPWLLVRETTRRTDLATWPIVPDGAMCGTIAARTLLKGAWYSPANQALRGALALEPPLDDAALTLLGNRVNPIVQNTRGFVAVDALTLSPDDEFRDLHVRRLLILLRRLAIREGSTFVFRNNDDSLRRLVQREFEQVLGDMFVRGAFAGTTHDEGYRVVTESTLNTPQSVDQGRFIAELRVAPSQPLAFLTVRLIQEGGALMVEEG